MQVQNAGALRGPKGMTPLAEVINGVVAAGCGAFEGQSHLIETAMRDAHDVLLVGLGGKNK